VYNLNLSEAAWTDSVKYFSVAWPFDDRCVKKIAMRGRGVVGRAAL